MDDKDPIKKSKKSRHEARIVAALEIARTYAFIEGEHHKTWVIDQMIRALTGDAYERWIIDFCTRLSCPDYSFEWDTGIAP